MTFTEAAVLVLRLAGKPLHFKEITDVAIERSLLSHVGKNPEVTMGARLSAQVKKNERDNPLTRVKPGVFALADWDDKKVNEGLSNRTPAIDLIRRAEEEAGMPLAFDGAVSGVSSEEDEPDEAALEAEDGEGAPRQTIAPPPDEDEVHRAELSAAATDLFEPEDDDDQPIFGAPAKTEEEGDDDEEPKEGRRRRRRRRGKRRDGEGDDADDDLPAYTVSDAPPEEVLAEVFEEPIGMDAEVQGPGLVTQLCQLLGKHDRSRGPVPAQVLLDGLRKVQGSDRSLGTAGVVAAAVADNLSRERKGEAPLFRVVAGKIGLFAWSLDKRGPEKLRALSRAAQDVRATTLRNLTDQFARLPHRAFGELVLVLIERMGLSQLTPIKRPGTHGAELHFAARAPFYNYGIFPGQDPRAGVPIAICVRRDGKDLGRERVTELRGALHHYDCATQGWLITAGQVLSGAREEASSTGGSPMVLIGRAELAELCMMHGVGVTTHRIEIPVLDSELFDSLPSR